MIKSVGVRKALAYYLTNQPARFLAKTPVSPNTVTWFGFLLAYEFLFRGILFFSVYKAWGFWPSVSINSVIYALVHFPKSTRETLGAIPFGFLMCYITYATGSIWAAFGIHLVMAIANDYFAGMAHKELERS